MSELVFLFKPWSGGGLGGVGRRGGLGAAGTLECSRRTVGVQADSCGGGFEFWFGRWGAAI